MTPPEADTTYYHDNTTIGVSVSKERLLKIDGLKVGYLTSTSTLSDAAAAFKSAFNDINVKFAVVAERLGEGIDQTYSATFAGQFDAIIVDGKAGALFAPTGSLANSNVSTPNYGRNTTRASTTLYPAGRPLQILQDGYHWGKAVAVVGASQDAFKVAGIEAGTPGVYQLDAEKGTKAVVDQIADGLHTFRFLDRYPLDH
jgi:catalase